MTVWKKALGGVCPSVFLYVLLNLPLGAQARPYIYEEAKTELTVGTQFVQSRYHQGPYKFTSYTMTANLEFSTKLNRRKGRELAFRAFRTVYHFRQHPTDAGKATSQGFDLGYGIRLSEYRTSATPRLELGARMLQMDVANDDYGVASAIGPQAILSLNFITPSRQGFGRTLKLYARLALFFGGTEGIGFQNKEVGGGFVYRLNSPEDQTQMGWFLTGEFTRLAVIDTDTIDNRSASLGIRLGF